MQENLISIIIPTYNNEKEIERCLKSIITQTYTNIEMIVINDGSTDSTQSILEKYAKKDKRIKILFQDKQGVSNARNYGMKYAKGEYLAFVDADDWIEETMYEKLMKKMQEYDCDIVRCNYEVNINEKNTIETGSLYDLGSKKISLQESNQKLFSYFMRFMPSYIWLLLIKRSSFTNLEFDNELIILEDKLFYYDLFCQGKTIYFYDEILYHYYKNKISVTNSKKNYEERLISIIQFVDKIKTKLENYNKLTKNLKKEIDNIYIHIIERYLFHIYRTNRMEEMKICFKRILANPIVKKLWKQYDEIYWKQNKMKQKLPVKLLTEEKYGKLKVYYLLGNIQYKITSMVQEMKNSIKKVKYRKTKRGERKDKNERKS